MAQTLPELRPGEAARETAMPPSQVAIFSHYYAPFPGGGAERQAQRLAETLAAQGWRMVVFTKRLSGLPSQETLNGVQVRRLWTSERRGPQSLLLTLGLLRGFLTAPRGQIIHLNQMYREILPALIARRLRGSPIVVRVACGGAYGDIARLQVIPAGRLMLRLARRADAIISLSQQITQELLAQGFAPERIIEIPNGVDTCRFVPVSPDVKRQLRQQLDLPDTGPLVLFVGRLHYQKGVETLLRAWQAVHRAEPRARLLLVGQGPDGERLERLAAELELGPSVHFLGQSDDVLPYLQASDVFVLPSLFEGLSNALLEAMACGLAVVSTAIGGTREVIRAGVEGVLVEPGDPGALAQALRQVIGDAAQAERLGAQARARVVEHYPAERATERYAALYARLGGFSQPTYPSPGLFVEKDTSQ